MTYRYPDLTKVEGSKRLKSWYRFGRLKTQIQRKNGHNIPSILISCFANVKTDSPLFQYTAMKTVPKGQRPQFQTEGTQGE
jgi:hypothetical protein